MIITRTPLRISYAGGGTDFSAFHGHEQGIVISTTIDKYIYVTVAKKFDGRVNIRYSEIEDVESSEEVKHGIVRECLLMVGIQKGIEITVISDVPSRGSGLGSSSALTVGLLKALYAFVGYDADSKFLAEKACEIEIDILGAPIGKQDQYAVAYGGLNKIVFLGTKVEVEPLRKSVPYCKLKFLEESSKLFYLGMSRNAGDILKEQKKGIEGYRGLLRELKRGALMLDEWLRYNRDIGPGDILNMSWEVKKKVSPCSSENIDKWVGLAKALGASGVKLVGAGGGGFMLVVVSRENMENVRCGLSELSELPFSFTIKGTEVIYNDSLHG